MPLKEIIPLVFLDVAIVVVAARLTGRLFRRLRQPAVVGEIVAGIVLGPSLLGLLPGDLPALLFPPDVRPYLNVIAQIGLVLFLFVVGLEADMGLIRRHGRTAASVSLASIVLPFGLGLLLASRLYDGHAVVRGQAVPPLAFGLFLGVAMSITAFPVLARILTERGIHRIPVGVLALACAAVDDVVAWSLLALVSAVAVGGTLGGVSTIVALTLVFAAVMVLAVRPLLRRLVTGFRAHGRLTPDVLAFVLVGVLLSAYATEKIGVHAIFGAFVFGAIMPRDEPALTREVLARVEQLSVVLLLPVFFVVAGLQVNVGAIGLRGLGELVLILLVAIGGKFLGAAAAAKAARLPQRQVVALGVLMNTRGLTEIVILQVGAQLGVLDPSLFTLMVLMAVITTVMTEPLLRRVYPDRVVAREVAAAERAELGDPDSFTIVVGFPPGRPAAEAAGLVDVARGLVGDVRPARLVLCRFLPRHADPLELASGLGSDLTAVAAAGDELRALAARAGGVPTSVVVRFAAEPWTDLAALARAQEADVVVVAEEAGRAQPDPGADGPEPRDRPTDLGAALADRGDASLVTVRPPGAPVDAAASVGVLVDRGAGTRSAVRLATLLAAGRGDLAVGGVDDRRGPRFATAALQRRDVPATGLGSPADVDVLLVGADVALPEALRAEVDRAAAGGAVVLLRVHPAAPDRDGDLDAALDRVMFDAGAPAR